LKNVDNSGNPRIRVHESPYILKYKYNIFKERKRIRERREKREKELER